ncbi:transglycosylase SLT domain-containing protein [Neptunicoccus cionae]|uniref:transglycosylase SLT domain-containing protein n=1 Tax=Neptunicoccus cionae TaxID=2035344 RepID=UPI000C794BF1|nr:transglycosylase SLT domain-containing protein [Amylibacter cionae]PLS22669.1 lytic transglycosylase [Amylibacter cionae]
MKYSTILIAILILTACSGGRSDPPRNLDNACSILDEKRGWSRDLKKVERKYGVPGEVILATIYHESHFKSHARTPRKFTLGVIPMGRQSSAYGFAQAIDGTWDWYKRATGNRGAKRHNFDDAVDFMGWYMNESTKRNGIAKTDAYNQYLAYHQGHTGYKRGSYRNQQWLLNVAAKVQARAILYGAQLNTCR